MNIPYKRGKETDKLFMKDKAPSFLYFKQIEQTMFIIYFNGGILEHRYRGSITSL